MASIDAPTAIGFLLCTVRALVAAREELCGALCSSCGELCCFFLPRAARLEIAGRLLFMEENPAHALLRVFDERTGRSLPRLCLLANFASVLLR